MAESLIHHDIKNGPEYASIYTPGWSNGKKMANGIVYPGKVIDKKRGFFKNDADLLPLCVCSEITFRGLLMLTLLSQPTISPVDSSCGKKPPLE